MLPARLEDEARAGGEIGHRPRDEHLPAPLAQTRARRWTATPATPSPWICTSPVCTPARTSSPRSRTASRIAHAQRNGARGAVERREEAVTGGVDLAAAVALELAADDRVVAVEQVAPGAVAERDCAVGRPDDVGEDDGREHAVGLGSWTDAGEELLDLVGQPIDVAAGDRMLVAG